MRLRSHQRQFMRRLAIIAAVLVVVVGGLLFLNSGTNNPALPTPSPIGGGPTTGATPTPSATGTSVNFGGTNIGFGTGFGTPGPHTVILTIKSNAELASVEYLVPTAHKSGIVKYVNPPFTLTVTANGPGILAAVAAQASAGSTSISCTIDVDGSVRTTRAIAGPYRVVLCYG